MNMISLEIIERDFLIKGTSLFCINDENVCALSWPFFIMLYTMKNKIKVIMPKNRKSTLLVVIESSR